MKNLVLLLLLFLFLPKLGSSQVIYLDPKDEKDVHYDMRLILESLNWMVSGMFNKPLYIKKIDSGVVYIDKTKYKDEEIKYIQDSIKKLIDTQLSGVDKTLSSDSDLGFDSGRDLDYDWGDEEFVSEQKTSNIPKSDSSWYLQEQTTQRWYDQTDTVYFKDSKISVSGIIYKRFNNNKVKICAEYVDGVKNGFYNEYYDNGQLQKKYFNKNGSISGEYIEYFKNGNLLKEEFYDNGSIQYMTEYHRDGSVYKIKTKPDENGKYYEARYDYKGEILELKNYKNGQPHGRFEEYYRANKPRYLEKYSEGKREGVQKYWYENGNPEKVVNIKNGYKEHGKQTYYYENGRKKREYSKINGNYDGNVLSFYETEDYEKEQLSSKMFFSNGKKEGKQREYYKNGQLQFEGNYSSGSPIGIHKYWFEYNGVVGRQLTYTNKKNYSEIVYHQNGKKSMQYTVVNSLIEGVQYTWYNNGAKKSLGNYKNGKLHGSYKEWYSNGNLKFEKNYYNGKEVY